MKAGRLPSHEAMVRAIVAGHERATNAQRDAGRAWYGAAGTIVDAIADATGRPRERVALAVAALSPRNPWRWNVADAYAFAVAARDGGPRPTATTFSANADRAWQALRAADGDPWTSAAPKGRAFAAAVLGDKGAVVVDTWAMRVATDGALADVRRGEYAAVADAYRAAAIEVGEWPVDLQAITWLVAQSEGLASRRRGRHDMTFKAGTATFVRELLGAYGA